MKLKFKKWYQWNPYLAYKDIVNYIDWIKTIRKEKKNPNSKFNSYKLNHNFFYTLYIQVSLEDGDDQLPDIMQKQKVIEFLTPIHKYLDEDLGFAEYIVPEFNQFYVDGKPTLTYGVLYIFAFNKLSFKYILKYVFYLAVLLFILLKHELILSWIR
jgi:hypothetical protein